MDIEIRLKGFLGSLLSMNPEQVMRELIGANPERIWLAVAATGRVRLCLRERRDPDSSGLVSTWLSRRDAAVCTHLVASFTRWTPPPKITVCYAPASLYGSSSASGADSTAESTRLFHVLRKERRNASTIYIGSQKSNDLVELFVAELFGCAPFSHDRAQDRVPFHLTFRKGTSAVQSCFGGQMPAPGSKHFRGPGIAYLDEEGQWRQCPWDNTRMDSGIVIVVRDLSINSVEIVCLY